MARRTYTLDELAKNNDYTGHRKIASTVTNIIAFSTTFPDLSQYYKSDWHFSAYTNQATYSNGEFYVPSEATGANNGFAIPVMQKRLIKIKFDVKLYNPGSYSYNDPVQGFLELIKINTGNVVERMDMLRICKPCSTYDPTNPHHGLVEDNDYHTFEFTLDGIYIDYIHMNGSKTNPYFKNIELLVEDYEISNGGGATHIAKITGQLKDLSSNLSDILMVSGGGGGGTLMGDTVHEGADAGGIAGSGSNSANQSTGNAFGQGESGTDASGGGSGLYGGYKGRERLSGIYAPSKIGDYQLALPLDPETLYNGNYIINYAHGSFDSYFDTYGDYLPNTTTVLMDNEYMTLTCTVVDNDCHRIDVLVKANSQTYQLIGTQSGTVRDQIPAGVYFIINENARSIRCGTVMDDGWYLRIRQSSLYNYSDLYNAIVNSIPVAMCSAGAGSGYIGNSLLSNKKMVGYNVPTSSVESTKTESTNVYSASGESNKPKAGNGKVKITLKKGTKIVSLKNALKTTDFSHIKDYRGGYSIPSDELGTNWLFMTGQTYGRLPSWDNENEVWYANDDHEHPKYVGGHAFAPIKPCYIHKAKFDLKFTTSYDGNPFAFFVKKIDNDTMASSGTLYPQITQSVDITDYEVTFNPPIKADYFEVYCGGSSADIIYQISNMTLEVVEV